ncbi:MAG: hypothetical protein ACJ73S_06085 [Mycobacteriales bacterium]
MPEPERVLYGQVRPYAVAPALDDLTGPTEGTVHLPIMLAWSGQRDFDVTDEADLRMLYQIVLQEGGVSDFERYLNATTLRRVWPELFLPLRVRRLWEQRFPELKDG